MKNENITQAYNVKGHEIENMLIREWVQDGLIQWVINGTVVRSAYKTQPYNYKKLEDMKGDLL